MATTEGVREAIALLEDVGLLKPTNDELRRARAWEAVIDQGALDADLQLAVKRLARSAEKQYGSVTPKQLNNELRRIRNDRIHQFATTFAPPHPYVDPVLDLAYQRAYLAAIGDGSGTEQADCEGQAGVEMVQYILMTEPGTPEHAVLTRMETAIKDGERPWRAEAHRFKPHKTHVERRGGGGTRTYGQLVESLQERIED